MANITLAAILTAACLSLSASMVMATPTFGACRISEGGIGEQIDWSFDASTGTNHAKMDSLSGEVVGLKKERQTTWVNIRFDDAMTEDRVLEVLVIDQPEMSRSMVGAVFLKHVNQSVAPSPRGWSIATDIILNGLWEMVPAVCVVR